MDTERAPQGGDTKPPTKAQIASRAQALAHKDLREAHPDEYRRSYQRHKDDLTARDEGGAIK